MLVRRSATPRSSAGALALDRLRHNLSRAQNHTGRAAECRSRNRLPDRSSSTARLARSWCFWYHAHRPGDDRSAGLRL